MKNKYISYITIICFSLIFSLSACLKSTPKGHGHDHGTEAHDDQESADHSDHEDHGHDHDNNGHDGEHQHGDEKEKGNNKMSDQEEHDESGIHLSREQVKTVGIAFGDFIDIKINDYVHTTGTLGLPPQSYATVSAKAGGFIKNSKKYVEGSSIKKGAVLAYLESPDFIKQQQEYLEVAAELSYLSQELNRQQKLVDANAGVIQKLQKLQSEVNMKMASLKGMAKQLSYLGIKVTNLSPENIVQRIAIFSPMSGYVTSINMHNGMFVTPQLELMEIVTDDHLHLELDVFEKDIANIKEEQRISYTVPALGSMVYQGDVHVIGKEFNLENKTVRIHGHVENERPKFIKGLYVDAKIWLNDQTVQALPEAAIVMDEGSSYIYVANDKKKGNEVQFQKIMVLPGTTDKGNTAVKLIGKIPEGMKIVTNGAYYVYAQSKAGELEHHH